MNRPTTLLADLAAQFERLDQPASLQWMQDRGVTLEELQAVSREAAVALRRYASLPDGPSITLGEPEQTTLGARQALAEQKPSASTNHENHRQTPA